MDIAIRTSGLEEIEELLEWRMRVLQEVFSLPEDAETDALLHANEAYYREHLRDGSHLACFAVDAASGRIVGCGGICYQREMPSPDNPSGTCGYLMNIFALPELRGHGIGKKIVEFLVADARNRGTGKIYLESSEVAEPLYRNIGFSDLPGYMKLRSEAQ